MSILVTGSAGFIAGNFIKTFRIKFPEAVIIGIDDFSTGRRDALDPTITFYEGSTTDADLLSKIFTAHKPEYVFHFAAVPRVAYSVEHPTRTTHANILGTVALLEASKNFGVKRFIFSSSSSVYGGAQHLPTTESDNPPHPVSPYALQKYGGELYATMFSKLYGLDTVSLRYFNVFGPGQYGESAYATVICGWLEGLYFPNAKRLFLEDDGLQSRDFCYVENVVEANILAMQSPEKLDGDVFNIAHGERTTLLEVKSLIEQLTGKTLDLEKRPPRHGDVRHTHADISKAHRVLGYQPTIDFKEGLKKTVAWFEERKNTLS